MDSFHATDRLLISQKYSGQHHGSPRNEKLWHGRWNRGEALGPFTTPSVLTALSKSLSPRGLSWTGTSTIAHLSGSSGLSAGMAEGWAVQLQGLPLSGWLLYTVSLSG